MIRRLVASFKPWKPREFTQNYWVFGLLPTSGILETRKHDVSETGSVSVLRWRGKTPTQLGPLERANLDHWSTGFPCQLSFYQFIYLSSGAIWGRSTKRPSLTPIRKKKPKRQYTTGRWKKSNIIRMVKLRWIHWAWESWEVRTEL
jgi:hypothetical protein